MLGNFLGIHFPSSPPRPFDKNCLNPLRQQRASLRVEYDRRCCLNIIFLLIPSSPPTYPSTRLITKVTTKMPLCDKEDGLPPSGFHLHFEFGVSWMSARKGRRLTYVTKQHKQTQHAGLASGHSRRGSSRRRSSSAPPVSKSTAAHESRHSSRSVPVVSKALPATPNQYRLGEAGMPWTPSAFPEDHGNYDIDAQMTEPQVDDRERGRSAEMASLAAAMMTVDNGFEDQWWYQGTRQTTQAGDLISPASLSQSQSAQSIISFLEEES